MSVFHSSSESLINQLRSGGGQSLLISGPEGVGLLDIARAITEGSQTTLLSPDETKASRHISAEMIRELYDMTRSKSVGKQYVIIAEADAMTKSAQGAFLKLLEEPNASIHFILISSLPDVLLPTIRSRVQQHTITPISSAQSATYLNDLGVTDETTRKQLLYIAEGLPEELARLATDEAYFSEAVQRMKDARELLQASQYERLLVVNRYRDNRVNAQQLVAFATSMTRRSLSQRPQKSLVTQLDKLLSTREELDANANVRLTLTRLVV
jgi:DNA polymerase III delta prime subunit